MRFTFLPMLLWILLVFGGGHVYMTYINPTPTTFQILEKEVDDLSLALVEKDDRIESTKQELSAVKKAFNKERDALAQEIEILKDTESEMKSQIENLFEITGENADYIESLESEINEKESKLGAMDEIIDQQETDLIKLELDMKKNEESWGTHSASWPEIEGDSRFSIQKEYNTDYDDSFNYKYFGTVDASATQIEVFISNNQYGDLSHYVLTKFVPGDTTREYFTSPRFGTVMPGINTYRFIVTWLQDWTTSTTEYISTIEVEWTKLINMIEEDGNEKYSGTVKLNGTMKKSIVEICSIWIAMTKEQCLDALWEMTPTIKYSLVVDAPNDPRWYRFDGISNYNYVSLWCLQIPELSKKFRSPIALEVLKNREDNKKVGVLLNTKYSSEVMDFGACGIDSVIESFDIVE